jgi:hypothetical protein
MLDPKFSTPKDAAAIEGAIAPEGLARMMGTLTLILLKIAVSSGINMMRCVAMLMNG